MGDRKKMSSTDKVILQKGKLALVETIEAIEERLADQQTEDGIPEEFQTLVISLSLLSRKARGLSLVSTGTVRNGTGQQSTARELLAEGVLEFVQIGLQLLRGRRAFRLDGARSCPPARCSLTLAGASRRVHCLLEPSDCVIGPFLPRTSSARPVRIMRIGSGLASMPFWKSATASSGFFLASAQVRQAPARRAIQPEIWFCPTLHRWHWRTTAVCRPEELP